MRMILILAVLAGLAGCATVDGIGQDLSTAANATEDMLN